MTSQKHLKAAVRARMARTGERYTAARRHLVGEVVGEVVGEPAGAVPGYRTFGGGRHHDSALLTHVLAAAGVTAAHDGEPLDEPMVAGLAGGIGFMYFSFSYVGHVPTMTIVPRIHPRPFLLGALERAGVPHRVAQTTSAAKAARDLDAALDAGRTPVCTVDRSGLGHQVWADSFPGAEPYDVAVAGRRGDDAAAGQRPPHADRGERGDVRGGPGGPPQEPAPHDRRRAGRGDGGPGTGDPGVPRGDRP